MKLGHIPSTTRSPGPRRVPELARRVQEVETLDPDRERSQQQELADFVGLPDTPSGQPETMRKSAQRVASALRLLDTRADAVIHPPENGLPVLRVDEAA